MKKPAESLPTQSGSVPKLRHTRLARRDLIDIWVTIARDNEAAADRVFARLEARGLPLAEFPEMGQARPDIDATARVLVEQSRAAWPFDQAALAELVDQAFERRRRVRPRPTRPIPSTAKLAGSGVATLSAVSECSSTSPPRFRSAVKFR